MISARQITIGCLVLLLSTTSGLANEPSHAQHSTWHPWFEIGGYYNSRDDDETGSFGTSRGETTMFVPILGGERDLLFTQITAKFFDDDAQEGNLALGYRTMTGSTFNLGAWIGGDVRHTEIENTFWQLSGGFEALSHNFDARLNWYGPVSSPQAGVPGFARAQLAGNQIFIIGGEEIAMMGIDGEIGARLPTEFAGLDPNLFELRLYGGGFYFEDSDAIDDISGAKGRVELRINDVITQLPGSKLTAEYEISHDDVRDTRHEVGMRLRIPFAGTTQVRALSSLTGQQRRMLDGIERDTDIITAQSRRENVEDALTSVDFDRVAFASNSVTATSNAAGANSLIIVNGTVVGTQTVQANQTLQGGSSTIQVRGRRTGAVVPFTAPGAAGRLRAPGAVADNLTLLGSNTHVSGLSIVGAGPGAAGDGVEVGDGKSNIFLTNLDITNSGDDGVDIDDNNTVTFIDVRISNTDESGISIEDNNTISITGGSITNPGEDGVQMNDDNTVTISGLTITNAGIDAIFLDDRNVVSITGLTVNGASDDGIQMDNDNTVSITNSTFTNTNFGVFTDGADNNVSITNTTFADVGSVAILDGGTNNTFRVTGATFRNIGGNVFDLNPGATLFISNTTFAGTVGGDVFQFFGGPTQVLAGSTGNVNATTNNPTLCDTPAGGSFTGTIGFVDGTVLQDNVLPCN